MVDEASASQDIRMQREMWSDFCKIVKWAVIGIVVLLALMAIFLV